MIYLGYILFIAAVGVIIYPLLEKEETISLRGAKRPRQNALKNLLAAFSPFTRLLARGGYRRKIEEKLSRAHWDLNPEEFLSLKFIGALGFPFLLYMLNLNRPVYLVIALLFGFFLGDLIMRQKIKARQEAILNALPETVDLLSLCVGAGLDFLAAVRWIIEKAKSNAMIEELKKVLDEINVGKPRVQALRDMAKRLRVNEVTSFTRILIQADKMGTPVEEVFRIVSEDNRRRRRNQGERQAYKAPIKMLIPLIFCILPVILIIVGGPIIIQFLHGGFNLHM